MESILKRHFGYSSFRPYQKETIEKILEGRDCLGVMATGSGKSLCYQMPPLIANKTCIVISPLISLMQDQVMALKHQGTKAEYLSSVQTDSSVQTRAENGQFHILYMTPEKAASISTSFWLKLQSKGICLMAVDEAHCISEWGHDFRVEYKQLDKLRDVLCNVPFVGLTATATEKVQKDIINSLKMRDPYIKTGSFDRKNLFYGVKSFNRGSLFMDQLVREISKFVTNAGATIIYCTTIKDAEQIFKSLLEAGIKVGIYHGQMGSKAREDSHRSFVRDEYHVMVATIAFGMGIDKPNIRYVIHYGCPKSLENYYQESGRCGRDGIPSVCWLYYTRSDFAKADFYCGEARTASQRTAIMESYKAAQNYCMVTSCRRKFLLNYFGEEYTLDECGNCDYCLGSRDKKDMSKEAFLLMACIQSCGGHWGLNLPVDILRGSRSKKIVDSKFDKLPFHGLGKDLLADWWKRLAYQLIAYGYLIETVADVYRTVSVSPKGVQFLSSCRADYQPSLFLPVPNDMAGIKENQHTLGEGREFNGLPSEYEGLSEVEAELYKMLLEERLKLAQIAGSAPYAICGDQTLKRMALTRPSTKARLANIDGINQHLLMRYGDQFLQSIQRLSQALNISLDGNPNPEPAIMKKTNVVPNHQRKLTPAKFEAWKMWQEDGLSLKKIANFPGRSAPIKEQTVLNYLLEAAREGYAIDWSRLCEEIELTQEVSKSIQDAILKAGSKDRLKPIKMELPEEISYNHIGAHLAMQDLGIPVEILSSSQPSSCKIYENFRESSPNLPCHLEGPCELEEPADNIVGAPSRSEAASFPLVDSTNMEQWQADTDYLLIAQKYRKVDAHGDNLSTVREATESSIINWLKEFENGVPLSNILEHFSGSEEESVVELLSCLESEFLVFKKNDLYMIM